MVKSATVRTEIAENAQCKKDDLIRICNYNFSFAVVLPSGIHVIFISAATQQAMQLCVDEDLTQENNSKMIDKEILLNDIQTNGQSSNFYEFQQQIQVCDIYIIDYFYILIDRVIRKVK